MCLRVFVSYSMLIGSKWWWKFAVLIVEELEGDVRRMEGSFWRGRFPSFSSRDLDRGLVFSKSRCPGMIPHSLLF